MKPKFKIGQEIFVSNERKDKIIKIYEIRELKTKLTVNYLYEFNDIVPLLPEGILVLYNKFNQITK